HRDERGGFFTLILQPPDNPPATDVTPKEIVFVLDTSGSMSGFPIEKAKEAMKLALDGLHPNDTFNLITFSGDTHVLFPEPVPATSGNLARAQKFLESRSGNGGTEMMKAIKAALEPTDSQQHVRIVCFMTDGHVGNDNEIIAEVQKHQNARIFSFGIGNSVNRNLLDKIAEEGRGEAEYVSLESDGSAAAKRFHERVRSPLLTDVSIDWNGLPVADVYPQKIQDLFSAKPVVIHGRFTGAAKGVIRLKGKAAGREIVREIPVTLPENEPAHDTLATLWARSRVEDLTKQDYENKKPEVREAITNLGLEFRLLTRFTSFVAVEELIVTEGGQPRRVDVPIESPEGTKIQGNITAREIQALPKGASFSSLMSTSAVVDVSSDSSNSIDMTQSSVTETIDVARITGSGSGRGIGGGFSIKRNENSFVIDGQEASRLRTGILNAGNSSANSVTLNGKATNLPKPVLAPNINWDGSDGLVNVRIETHENGNVTSATAESGNPLLRAAAIQAAQSSKFRVTKLGDQPVQITGVIVYSFVLKNKKPKTSITFQNFAVKLTPEEQKRLELSAKVSSSVFLLIQRVGNAKAE
ncbi:MAG TPA: VWA domain-containing protein, partial [Pyrinomonadaceae bacterium]|nr:VWA domain-containing protein [Pyrinomonadaceae bacterium]